MGLEDLIYDILIEGGQAEEPSRDLAFHLALHWPDHARALLLSSPEVDPPELPEQPPVEPADPGQMAVLPARDPQDVDNTVDTSQDGEEPDEVT